MSGFKSLIARRLRVISGPGALGRLRRELCVAMAPGVRCPEARALAMLAVEEAAANVFEHGYGGRPGCPLEVTVNPGGHGRFAVTLRDRAPLRDVTALPAADLERLARDLATRGRGLTMMRRIAESMRHRARRGGGNELTLIFDAARLAQGVEDLRERAA